MHVANSIQFERKAKSHSTKPAVAQSCRLQLVRTQLRVAIATGMTFGVREGRSPSKLLLRPSESLVLRPGFPRHF